MPAPPLNPGKLITALLGMLPNKWRRLVVIGLFVVALLVLAYYLIERRLTGNAPPSVISTSLPVLMDSILLAIAVAAITATLVWLLAVLYLLFRQR